MSNVKLSRDTLIAVFIGFGLLLGWLEAKRISGGGEIPWVLIRLPDGQHASEFELGDYNELLVRSERINYMQGGLMGKRANG